jgi:hypothetical protein
MAWEGSGGGNIRSLRADHRNVVEQESRFFHDAIPTARYRLSHLPLGSP